MIDVVGNRKPAS